MQLRSTIITSQLPVALWHEALGEPTVADAILDRLLHNAHRIELHGESMRRATMADATGTQIDGKQRKRSPPTTSDSSGSPAQPCETDPETTRKEAHIGA